MNDLFEELKREETEAVVPPTSVSNDWKKVSCTNPC